MKKIITSALLLLASGYLNIANAAECPTTLSSYEQFGGLTLSIMENLPQEISLLIKNGCVDPLLRYENDTPPIYAVKNGAELNAFLNSGADLKTFTSDQGFPYIIPFQLYIDPYSVSFNYTDFVKNLITKINFPIKDEATLRSNLDKNVNHREVILKVIDYLPDYSWTQTDNRSLTPLGYLTFFREKEAIKKILAKNTLVIQSKDEDRYPVLFNLFLKNCYVDKSKTQQTDAEIAAIFIDNGFDPVNDKINYMSTQISFLDAVALYGADNTYMLKVLKAKGYSKQYAKAQNNAQYLKDNLPKHLGYMPAFDETRRNNPYNEFGDYTCVPRTPKSK